MGTLHLPEFFDHISRNIAKKVINIIIIFTGLFIGVSNASIISETWSGRIAGVNIGTTLIPYEFISWTVSYNDQSTIGHRWLDGANGIADFGKSDDIPLMDRVAGGEFAEDVDMISDAIYSFDSIFIALQDGREVEDIWNINASMVDHDTVRTKMGYNYVADAREFIAFADDETLLLEAHFSIKLADGQYSTLSLWDISRTVTTVPLPSAAYLFGSCILGLISVSRRKYISCSGHPTPFVP